MTRSVLPADAELIHRALTTSGPERPTTLAGDLDLTPERITTAFAVLRRNGLVRILGSGSRERWEAVPLPNSRGQRGRHAVAHRLAPMPESVRPALDAFPLGEGLRHLPSRVATNHRLYELYYRKPREVLGLSPETSFSEETHLAAARGSIWAKMINMRQREIGVLPFQPDLLVPYGGLRLSTDSYRQRDAVMKLIVIDRQFAFFPVDPHNFERGYLEVSQPPVVEALVALFEKEWDQAGGATEPERSSFQLTQRERAVVAQLIEGQTDAAVARALHLSERTISSIVRTMMERLEVRNRFQLGVALGRLDLAPMPSKLSTPGR